MRIKDDRLPKWPDLLKLKGGVWGVEGKHITYGRFVTMYLLLDWLYLFFIAALVYLFFFDDEFTALRNEQGVILLVILLIVAAIFLKSLSLVRFYCWFLWAKTTRVAFGPDGVRINSKLYRIGYGDQIQFRASERYVKPQKYRELEQSINGKQRRIKHAEYLIEFRKIEFIYGANVVLVANVPNDELAQQFVAVVQEAYKRANNEAVEAPETSRKHQTQKTNVELPE